MHQHGFHVERRFGWDTHGLPVEFEIDKTLGIKGPQDVAKMGIAAYNAVGTISHLKASGCSTAVEHMPRELKLKRLWVRIPMGLFLLLSFLTS